MKIQLSISTPAHTIYSVNLPDGVTKKQALDMAVRILEGVGPAMAVTLCDGVFLGERLISISEPVYDNGKLTGTDTHYIRLDRIEAVLVKVQET